MLVDREPQAGPDRAQGVTAIHSLDHFALNVPDVEKTRRFYDRFGLGTAERDGTLEVSALNGLAGIVFEGLRRTLHHVSFGIFEDDFAAFAARLEREHIKRIDPLVNGTRRALWFRDPDGHAIELAVLPRRAPKQKSIMRVDISPPGVPGAPEFSRRIQPKRLGHCLFFTPDVDTQIDFYTRILGMRLSDRSGPIIGFLHTPHGSDHHVVAFAKSTHPGFHHASFEVPGVDDIGIGAIHMAEHGYREGWGFGRHYVGSNYFQYIRDPWGSFAEYFCDIDYIPVGCAWNVRDVDPRFSLHVWGPDVPPYFLANYEGHDPSDI